MISKIRLWIPFAVTITLICGLMYGVVQQNYRQTANDPQIQISEDSARALSEGVVPSWKFIDDMTVNGNQGVDMEESLATFMVLYDKDRKVTFANGGVNGGIPLTPPNGVFDYVDEHGSERLTWEPREGVRIATVITKYSQKNNGPSGYVLTGRSLREVEKRVQKLTTDIVIGWFVAMALSFVSVLLFVPTKKK